MHIKTKWFIGYYKFNLQRPGGKNEVRAFLKNRLGLQGKYSSAIRKYLRYAYSPAIKLRYEAQLFFPITVSAKTTRRDQSSSHTIAVHGALHEYFIANF